MSVRQSVICDQCGDEGVAGGPATADWHNVSIHDHKSGVTRPLDLCENCWSSVRLPELLRTAAGEITR